MNMFNRFVFDNGGELINLTNKRKLKKESPQLEFKNGLFLEGQERECIEGHLFRDPGAFEIKLVTTWECNLRCSHCFVLHQLKRRDPGRVDVDMLLGFLKSYFSRFPTVRRGRIQFIGGEPALTASYNLEVMDAVSRLAESSGVNMRFHTNTNGFDLNDEIVEFYSRLSDLTISLDGPKELHDAQRKALDGSESPFERTLANINRLMGMGMRDKTLVQAAVGDEGANRESAVSFYKSLLMNGVRFDKIRYAFSVPTRSYDPGEKFKDARRAPFPVPCCKYRWMADFVICSDNNIYCDYFDASEGNRIGSLADPIEDIANNHRSSILENMPVLNDPKCQSCPVIGLCWGNCCNLNGLVRPSEICDREGLYEDAKKAAAEGVLEDFMYRRTADKTM